MFSRFIHIKEVRNRLRGGGNPNQRDDLGKSMLHLSSSEASTKLLLKSKADPNAQDQFGDTPLHMITFNDRSRIPLLLAAGANPNLRNNQGLTPIESQAEHADIDIIKNFLSHGVSFPEPIINPIFANLSYANFDQLAEKYGVIFPPQVQGYDKQTFFTQEIYRYYPKILRRENPYPYPPPINQTRPLGYYQDLLSHYTLQELFEAYEPTIVNWHNRNDVIDNIYHNYHRLIWSSRNRYCNNEQTLNIVQGEPHGSINKNDSTNPTYSYGRSGNYRCYQRDDLEAAWDVDRDPEHFNFLVPDWEPPVNGQPIIDPTTGRPLARFFPRASLEQFDHYLRQVPGERSLKHKIESGLNLLQLRHTLLTEGRAQYQMMSQADQDSVKLYLAWLLLFGMWMRFWKGPGYDWPKEQHGPTVCQPAIRDQHVIIQLAVRNEILDHISPALREWLLALPMVEGRTIGPSGSLNQYLGHIQAGTYCMGYGADAIIGASQKLIGEILGQDVNQLIQDKWQRLIELERRVVNSLRNHLTAQSDPDFARELAQRMTELQSDFDLPPELNLAEIGQTRHT